MTDFASLVLEIDSSQVPKGTKALDDLANAGKRAEVSSKGAAAAATQMAAQAQLGARAAVGLAGGMHGAGMAANNARIAMLDMTHVGINMTTMLASGVNPMRALVMESGRIATAVQYSAGGIRGLIATTAEWLGLVKVTRDAELAQEAASAAAAAAAVGSAAAKAAASITAADVELALARAQVETATTSEAETAAQARLALAHEAVAAAAREAEIAERALALAQGRATATADAEAATTARTLTARGAVISGALAATAIAGSVLVAVVKDLQARVRDTGALDKYANSLGLTKKEMKELRQEVGGLSSKEMKDLDARARAFSITWGDVFNGLKQTASDALDLSPAWQNFKQGVRDGFETAEAYAVSAAAHMYGYWVGGYRTIVQTFGGLGPAIGHAFAEAANAAISAMEGLINKAIDGVNSFANGVNGILGKKVIGTFDHVDLGRVADNYGKAGKVAGKSFGDNVAEATAEAQKQIAAQVSTIYSNIIGAAETRIKNAADTIIEDRSPKKGRKPRKRGDHGLQDALDELDAQIRGQLRLAAAYAVSDAAVIKAEALQKAEEDAIRHKGDVGIFYEKELAKAVAERVAEAARGLADLKFETDARRRANDLVESGAISAVEANQQLELEKTLRPFVAAAAVAEGDAKENLLAIINDLTQAQKESNAEAAREQYLRELASNDNDIDRLKLELTLIGHSNRERAIAIAQLEAMQKLKDLPGLSPEQQQTFILSNVAKAIAGVRTPFEQWADSVPRTAAAINDALQAIEVRGFDSLSSALTDVIMGTKSLGAAFKDVARSIISDIIQMTIRMLIFRAVSGLFGGGGGAAVAGGQTVPGAFAKGGVFSGGNVIPFAGGGVVSGPTLFPMSGGRTGLMGEAGEEAIMPLARDSRGRLGVRANDNSRGPIEIQIGFGPAPDFAPFVYQVSGAHAREAARISINHTNQTLRGLAKPKLNGGRG